MALTATMYRLAVDLSDVDRNVYEKLELRLARHPSESARYLYTRALAYALSYEEGIAFGKGLSTGEEPAIEVRDLQGTRTMWIDIGNPAFERLHKASKATARVAIWTHAPELLLRDLRGKPIHHADQIAVTSIAPAFLDEVDKLTDRNASWELTRNEGVLYLAIAGKNASATLGQHSLVEAT